MGIDLIDPNEEIRRYITESSGSGDVGMGSYFDAQNKGPVGVPLEDLVLFANLEVILPGRTVIIDNVAQQTENRQDIGFIVPKKDNIPGRTEGERTEQPYSFDDNYGQLGTSWSNIGGLEGFVKEEGGYKIDASGSLIRNGNPSETFGITSISVKLNASFEPQVFIEFVDIRGASLMEPGLRSPYAAFFHMPYPMFSLTIKGHYGKGINYKLHLLKFNSKFDAETGNFVISCEFIGFTFTYLADIPAIYADVGPELMSYYGEQKGTTGEVKNGWAQYTGGGDITKPYGGGGSMTLGTYISNIENMSAKLEFFNKESKTQEFQDVNDSINKMKGIKKRWLAFGKDCCRNMENNCYYSLNTQYKVIVNELYVQADGTPYDASVPAEYQLPASDSTVAATLRVANKNSMYSKLLLKYRGYSSKDAPSEGYGGFLGYVTEVEEYILNSTASNYITMPAKTGLDLQFYGEVKDIDLPGDENDILNQYGCGIIDGVKYFSDLDQAINTAESELKTIKKDKEDAERRIKLESLVMEPTLNNIFQMLCNGVGAFNKVIKNVGIVAEKQHDGDGNLRKMFEGSTNRGTDISEDAEHVFAFPLYYETHTDSTNVSRSEKTFPGWKTRGNIYGVPEFTTEPNFWPEIKLVEEMITTIIKKRKEMNSTWSSDDQSFGEGIYMPACLMEIPLGTLGPYHNLTDVETQIIPLLMLRTMLRVGYTNRFPVVGEESNLPDWGCDGTSTTNCSKIPNMEIRAGLVANSANSTEGDEEKKKNALNQLGRVEAESLISSILDTGNERLRSIYEALTGQAGLTGEANTNVAGTASRKVAWQAFKDAGYVAKESAEYFMTQMGGQDYDGGNGGDNFGIAKTDIYSFYGIIGNKSGVDITTPFGFYLPNVNQQLTCAVWYSNCENMATSSECADFYISSEGYYRVKTQLKTGDEATPEGIAGATKEQQDFTTSLIDYYDSHFMQGTNAVGDSSPVTKLTFGPQGTIDYNYQHWIGWDFFSYYSRAEADKQYNDNDKVLSESDSDWITPDQFMGHAILYSSPGYGKSGTVANVAGSDGYLNTDRQTFILEDALWIKNDYQNDTLNSDYSTTAPYSWGADQSVGYNEAMITKPTLATIGVGATGRPDLASNIALGYLYINSLGKKYTLSDKLDEYGQENSILDLFNGFGSNMVIPQYVVLQIGSLLYRYDNIASDIIKWPNLFNTTGISSPNGQEQFMIPKKDERMAPGSAFFSNFPQGSQFLAAKQGRRSRRMQDFQWASSTDTSNQIHFLSKGMGPFDEWPVTEVVTYEKIPKALLNLPTHIRKQFKERFVSWATGVHIGQTGVKIAPTFPTLKKYATETVDLPFQDDNRGEFLSFCKSSIYGSADIAANPNLTGVDQESYPYGSNFHVSGCRGSNYNGTNFMKVYNTGLCTRLVEGYVGQTDAHSEAGSMGGHPALGGNAARNMVVTYATREIPDGTNPIMVSGGNPPALSEIAVENLSATQSTYTLPLFLNMTTNMGPQGQNASDWTYSDLISKSANGIGQDMSTVTKWINTSDPNDDTTFVGFMRAISTQYYLNNSGNYQFAATYANAFSYYYIRKVSHTDKIVSTPQISDKVHSASPYNGTTYTVKNDSLGGFPDVGSSIYRNIQYQDPILTLSGQFRGGSTFSNWSTIVFEEDASYAKVQTDLWLQLLWWPINLPARGGTLKPTFTIREYSLKPDSYKQSVESEPNQYYAELRTLMRNRVTIKNPTWLSWLGVPKGDTPTTSIKTIWTNKDYLDDFFQGLTDKISEVLNKAGEREESMQATQRKDDIINDNDIKLDTYLTLKNIHDKWLTAGTDTMKESTMGYSSDDITWLFRQFNFVDRAYNNIGDKYIDPTPLLDIKKNPKVSIYTLMYSLIAFNKFEFFPLPTGIEQSTRNFGDTFTPFLTVDKEYLTMFPQFYVMYMGGMSDSLDLQNSNTSDRSYEFKNDGFDITNNEFGQDPPDFYDTDFVLLPTQSVKYGDYLVEGTVIAIDNAEYAAGTIKPDVPGTQFFVPAGNWECHGTSGTGTCTVKRATVKAFRVAFGQENQNFFKSLTLDQSEFKETHESLALIDALVKEEASTKNPQLKGQNLLNVYQKRSYSCEVEGFGMPQILPLQYFQLDHVPMFHGAYLITNVEHTITQGDMSTRFKGVRVAQTVSPYVSGFLTSVNAEASSGEVGEYTGNNDVFDAESMTVINGNVQRMGIWVDGIWDSKNPSSEIKLMMNHGFTNIVLELNHFPGWGCVGPTEGDESYKCTGDDSRRAWYWAPYLQFASGSTKSHKWTQRASFSLGTLKTYAKTIWEIGGGAVKLTLMDNIAASYYGIEDQCGGTKPDSSYTKLDWDAQGISQPMTFAQLAKELNTYAGGKVIQAIEWDCEGKYMKTKGSGFGSGNYSSGPKLRYYPQGHFEGGEKRDTILAMLKKHRQELNDLGLTDVEMGVNWNAGTNDNVDPADPKYYTSRSIPEFSTAVDYVCGQGYSHTFAMNGSKSTLRPNYGAKACSCATNGSGECSKQCGPSKHAFCDNPMRGPEENYNGNGYCLDDRYDVEGRYGAGVREAYNAAGAKRMSDMQNRDGKPYLIGGLAGYRNKFPGYNIQTTLDLQWNGFARPIPGNDSYGAVEIRWWSFNNLFGQKNQKRYKPFLSWLKAMKEKMAANQPLT